MKSLEFLKTFLMQIFFRYFWFFFRVCARMVKDGELHALEYEEPMHEEPLQPEIRQTFQEFLPKFFSRTL